jgi:hypothetical protein
VCTYLPGGNRLNPIILALASGTGALLGAVISGLFLMAIELRRERRQDRANKAKSPGLIKPASVAILKRRKVIKYKLILPFAIIGALFGLLFVALPHPPRIAPSATASAGRPQATTATSIAYPTSTSIPRPTPTPTGSAFIEPCIRADEGYWRATWLTYGAESSGQPLSRRADNLACYDFATEGFAAETEEGTETFGLHIRCGESRWRCRNRDIQRGLYAYLPYGHYEFTVSLSSIEILQDDQEINDVDLIMGLGDPLGHVGRSLIFRRVNRSGSVLVCVLEGYLSFCPPVAQIRPPDFGRRVVGIEVGEATKITLDGVLVWAFGSTESETQRLWIGYSFRSLGLIDAFVGFPESLWRFVSIEG